MAARLGVSSSSLPGAGDEEDGFTRRLLAPHEAGFGILEDGYPSCPTHRQGVTNYGPYLTCSSIVAFILHTLQSPLEEGLPQLEHGMDFLSEVRA